VIKHTSTVPAKITGLQLILLAVTGDEPGAIETAITVNPYTTPTAAIILLLDRSDHDDRPSFCKSLPDNRYSSTGVVWVSSS
jgi:hypothetical protein